MANLIHPARAAFLQTAIRIREEENTVRSSHRANIVAANTFREQAAIQKWIKSTERGGRSRQEFDELCAKAGLTAELGKSVLTSDDCAIFDVSCLLPRIADDDISSFCLDGLVLPGNSVIFLHFGRQDDLLLDDSGLSYLEGAYVMQVSREMDDDAAQAVRVLLVKSDPDFDDRMATRATAETLRRNTEFVTLQIEHGQLIRDADDACWDVFSEENGAVFSKAFHHAVRAAIYVSQPGADLQYGYQKDAPIGAVGQAMNGVAMARTYLADEGFPEMLFAGRSPLPIARLEEPDCGARRYMGGP